MYVHVTGVDCKEVEQCYLCKGGIQCCEDVYATRGQLAHLDCATAAHEEALDAEEL